MDVRITYSDVATPSAEPSAVYSYLAMAGYLKAVRTGSQEGGKPVCRIGMVNREVSYSFKSLMERATAVIQTADSAISSIYAADPVKTKKNIEAILAGLAMDSS
ncbi:MAG: hypothetical protein IJ856_05895 [Candidatus Methanomethylophilaceae archaeon]|nr:hypothetical protein [Candidatus Methanomethylophilaceae archaeon]